jgi:cytidylate kinase
MDKNILIGVVGPCASGKTTLVGNLKRNGFNPRHIAQEHSYVQDMWKRITNPDVMIYLDVDYPSTINRKNLDWTEREFNEQQRRLKHARDHANLVIDTTRLTTNEVFDMVIKYVLSSPSK